MDQFGAFNDLPMEFLASMVYRNGKFVKAISYTSQTVCLYSIHTQFFEVWYDNNDNEINDINMVVGDDLDKFLTDIVLPKNLFH